MSLYRKSASSAGWRKPLLHLIVSLAVVFLAAGIGAKASIDAASFYVSLSLPEWAPPPTVFGPVWSLLYLMMAIAAWRISLLPAEPERTNALILFLAQLIVNVLWSWLFFAWKLGGPALADVLLLLVLIALCIWRFWQLDRPASVLFLPYLLWVGFATALTWSVWQRNPAILG